MTLRGYTGISKLNITGALQLAVRVLTESQVPQRLQTLVDDRARRGRPSHLPQYTALSVLATWFQLMYSNQPPSVANMLNCHWFDYTGEQLNLVGLSADWRDAKRAHMIRTNRAIYRQEYDRLHDFVTDLLDPIDDTPIQAVKNVTNAELRKARTDTADVLHPKTTLADQYMNDIVAATIDTKLFAGYRASLSVDLHNVGVLPSRQTKPAAPKTVKAGPPMAGYWIKHRRLRGSYCVGLTCAVAVSEPGQPPVPNVALGVGFGQPKAADTEAALTAIDAADRHAATQTTGSNHTRWVIGDKAYAIAVGFNAELNSRKRSLLMDYPRGNKFTSVYDLRAIPEDTDGPHLVGGVIVCPAISGDVARRDQIHLHDQYDGMSADAAKARQERLDFYEAARMPTNGRPVQIEKRPPGRPRKNAPTGETIFKVEVFCPARRGKLRCTRYQPSIKLHDRPYVDPPKHVMSYVCEQRDDEKAAPKTALELTADHFKNYSPLMVGTFEHHDFYKHARAHNEGFHTYLVANEAANLNDRTLRGRRNSSIRMTITLGVAIANIRSTDAFLEARKTNGGTSPTGQRTRIKHDRREALAS